MVKYMKIMLNVKNIPKIKNILKYNNLRKSNISKHINLSPQQVSNNNYNQNKLIKKIIKFFKPKDFKEQQSPIIGKLETPYGRYENIPDPNDLKFDSVDRIMAEIYIKQAKDGYPSYTINHNIEQLRTVPEAVKKLIKPLDINPNGHIDQNTINKAYSIAKKAGDIPPYEYPPTFAGENHISEETISNIIPERGVDISQELPPDISKVDNSIDVVDSRFKIFDKVATDNSIDVDNITDLSEQTSDILSSELMENAIKKSGNLLENLLDSLPDFH